MRTQFKREKVSGVPGFMVTHRPSGDVYEFRPPGSKKWTRVPAEHSTGVQEAKRWRNKYLGLPEHERVVPTQIKFLDYAICHLEATQTIQAPTRRLYLIQVNNHMKPLHRLRLHEITRESIRAMIEQMRENEMAPNSIRIALAVLSNIMSAAVEDKLILVNPVSQLGKRDRPRPGKKRKRILKPDEAARLIKVAKPEYRPIIALMLFAGMRISEVLGLTWGDIDLRGRKIHVWRQLARLKADVTIDEHWRSLKGDNGEDELERYVEMAPVLHDVLIAHRGDRIAFPGDFVFTTRNARPYQQRTIQRVFKATVKAAGLDGDPELTPHGCRHNFASALIAAGKEVGYVSDQLGHANSHITHTIYRHEFRAAREGGTVAEAIDAIYGAAMRNAMG